jgi:hypothetical protein
VPQTQRPIDGSTSRVIDRIATPDLLGIKKKQGDEGNKPGEKVGGFNIMQMPSPSPQSIIINTDFN